MRSAEAGLMALLIACASCGGGGGNGLPTSALTNGYSLPALSGKNVLPLSISGSRCTPSKYPNEPCVSVTVCPPGSPDGSASGCQTIDGVLVDTGSYGFRVFKSVLSPALAATLAPVASGSGTLTECAQYGDGSGDWGPVAMASLVLGGEPAVELPIQLIDAGFATAPRACSSADTNPSDAGFNVILGVGLFAGDCGSGCALHANNGVYYSCAGPSCSAATAPLDRQVQNPVSLLPQDGNGLIFELPRIDPGGVASLDGYLVLGIGTSADNTPSQVTAFAADSSGNYSTTFNGESFLSFIDSGSNGTFFPTPSLLEIPDCAQQGGFFCPSSLQDLTAVSSSASGSPQTNIPFQVGNADALLASENNVFIELGGDGNLGGAEVFDWGLPFFIGRNVYFGLENQRSSLGTGPYWAY